MLQAGFTPFKVPAGDVQFLRNLLPGAGKGAFGQVVILALGTCVVVRIEHVGPDEDLGFRIRGLDHPKLADDTIRLDLAKGFPALLAGLAGSRGALFVRVNEVEPGSQSDSTSRTWFSQIS